jgi:hypothetical protein
MRNALTWRLEGQLSVLEPLRHDHLDGLFDAARPHEIWGFWPFNPAT